MGCQPQGLCTQMHIDDASEQTQKGQCPCPQQQTTSSSASSGHLACWPCSLQPLRTVEECPACCHFPLPDCSWGLPFACLLGIWRWHDTCPVFLWICLSFSSSFTDVFLQLEWTHVGLCTMDSLIYSLTCLLFMESLVTSLASVSLYSWHYLCADVIETFHFASF